MSNLSDLVKNFLKQENIPASQTGGIDTFDFDKSDSVMFGMIVGANVPDVVMISPPSDGDLAISRASVVSEPSDSALTEDTIESLIRSASDDFYNPGVGDFRVYLLAALYADRCVSPNTKSRGYVAHFPTTLSGELHLLLLRS